MVRGLPPLPADRKKQTRSNVALRGGGLSAGTVAAGRPADGEQNYGRETRESTVDTAARLVAALKASVWRESDLPSRRKGDPRERGLGRAIASGNAPAAEMDLRAAGDGFLEIHQPKAL